MNVRKWLLLLISLVFVLSSCGPATQTEPAAPEEGAPPTTAEEPAEPVTLRVGWAGSPDSLNPGVATLMEAYTIFELVYQTLYNLELDGSYTLELAESANVSEDGLVWTFKIRQDAKWHDGQPVTAQDVAFTYNYYTVHEDFPYMPAYTTYFESVEATDDATLVIKLTEAIPNMESQTVFMYILPEHIWKDHDADAFEFENLEMIGSGPFKMQEYKQSEYVHLVANQDYDGTQPKIDAVIFQTFENQDALVQAIKTGQVDMITEMPNTALASLQDAENVQVVTGAPLSADVADIIINQTAPENCPTEEEGGICSGHPALRDVTVRQALAHATDKQKLIDVVLLGLGDPGLTLIPRQLGTFFNSELDDFAYDTALANQMLEEAGYLDSNGDSVREDPEGKALTFRLNYPSDSTTAPREAELLSEMWKEIGITVEIQPLDGDTLTAICCPAFDYDIMLWGWGCDPDPGFQLSIYLGSEIPSGLNETGYFNATYDELYAQQATELDPEKRREIIWEMQRMTLEDVVYIIPWYGQAAQAFRTDRFQGWITDQPKVALEDTSSLLVVEPVP